MLTKLSVILFLVFCVLFSFAEESYARCGDCVNLTGKQQPGSWGPNSIDYSYANECEGMVTVTFDKGNGGKTSERFERGETKTVGCTSQDCPYSKFSEVCTEPEKQQSNPAGRSDLPAPNNGDPSPTGQSIAPAPSNGNSPARTQPPRHQSNTNLKSGAGRCVWPPCFGHCNIIEWCIWFRARCPPSNAYVVACQRDGH
jgi:hypothetical protein